MRYLKSALNTFKSKLRRGIIITSLGVLAFTVLGYMKAKKDIIGAVERQEKIDTYLSQVEKYETAIADSKEALLKAEEQHAALKEYADNAVYMKLDSNNVWVGSVQYTVQPGEGTSTGNVLNAMNLYVTQGGLKEDIGEEHEELGVKYWSEVIGTSVSGQTLSITIMQSTEDLAKRSIELIKKRLVEYAPVVAESHGKFEFVEQSTSIYTKSEAGIVNTQNARRNDLKSYETNHSDLEKRVFNDQNTLDQYIENNKPDSLEVKPVSVKKTVVIFAVIGLLVGLWIAIGIVLIDYIAGNRVKSEEDVKKLGLEILGVNDIKKGFIPDAAQTAVGINGLLIHKEMLPLLDAPAKDGVALYDIAKSEDTVKVCDEYTNALKDTGCAVSYVDSADNGADSLKELLGHGSAVIVASAGDSRIDKIQEALRKFDHYGIKCLGAIVLK